jgi:hypothetical protein
MNEERDLSVVKSILPIVNYDKSLDSNEIESFQNEVIRPILKFQNQLLNLLVLERVTNLNARFKLLSNEEKEALILSNVKKDIALRNQLIGIVLAFFTLEEFQVYSLYNKELSKRIVEMIVQRVLDQYKHFL